MKCLKPTAQRTDTHGVSQPGRDETQRQLQAAYQHYRVAMASWRFTAKAGSAETTEHAADVLLSARVALYRSLLATGWVPPHDVEVQLDRDAALLAAPEEFDRMLASR